QRFALESGLPNRWTQPLVVKDAVFIGNIPMYVWNEASQEFIVDERHRYYPGRPPYGFEHLLRDANGDSWVAAAHNAGNLVPRPSPGLTSAIVAAGLNIDAR